MNKGDVQSEKRVRVCMRNPVNALHHLGVMLSAVSINV